MLSNNKIFDQKLAKRGDAMRVPFNSLLVRDGFNTRHHDEYFEEKVGALVEHIEAGGYIPPLVVEFEEDGRCYIVDGHRRHAALERLGGSEHGDGYVDVNRFVGERVDAIAMIVTSADGEPLRPLEMAEAVQKMADEGASQKEIARLIRRTPARVSQLITLASAPGQIKEMVWAGKLTAAKATELTRKYGEDAVAHLLAEAEESTQPSIDAAEEKPVKAKKTAKAKVNEPIEDSDEDVRAELRGLVQTWWGYQHEEDRIAYALMPDGDAVSVTLPIELLRAMLELSGVDYLTGDLLAADTDTADEDTDTE